MTSMAVPEGMVAVVKNAETPGGLCVTLMDGNRQYTLMPNSEVPFRVQTNPSPYTQKMQSTTTATICEGPRNAYDNSAQAVDGQYASMYKMAHCNLQPTSPPVELTEFPPQRPQVYPGQENFVIGGCSHSNPITPRNSNSFRMGASCVAQGVPAPRPAHRRDEFAGSLRNYPPMSAERSAEVLQRLVNYSNMRNNKHPDRLMAVKNHTSHNSQFSKCPAPEEFQQIDRFGGSPGGVYDESPTRDRWKSDEKQSLPSCDVRSLTEDMVKDFQRDFGTYPANVYPTIMEGTNQIPFVPAVKRRYSVNMETQADVPTVSREISTVPRPPSEVRNVAVFATPASTSPSRSGSQHRRVKIIRNSKSISIQTNISDVLILRRKSVQTCFSSVNLENYRKDGHKRRSKSQVELKITDDEQIVEIVQDLTRPSAHLRSKKKKVKKQKYDKHDPKVELDERENERLLFSERNLKEFTRELSNDLLSEIKRQNIFMQPTDLYRANYFDLLKKNREECFIDDIVIRWLKDIPIKRKDYLGRPIIKEHVLKTIGDKIQNVLINKLKYISETSTKTDIIDILDDMPINVAGHTRRLFLNKIVSELISTVKNYISKKEWKKLPAFCDYIQPTDEEVKQYTENAVTDLQRKFSLLICHDTVGQLINELAAILLDSMEAIRRGKIRDVIDEVITITSEFVNISEFQSIYFAHNLVYNLFQQSNGKKSLSCEFFCYSSHIQENISNNSNSSVENETEYESRTYRPDFAGQIAVQVNEWLSSIKGVEKINPSSKLVIVNDLTGDIVDRHKYLQMNPALSNPGVEELEHLKYQIFKWVNKVLGEDNTDVLSKAPDLLARIKSIPVKQNESQEGIVTMPKPTERPPNVINIQRRDSRPNGQPNQSSIKPVVVLRTSAVPSSAQNKSIKQLNEEYDAYVKDWVQRVPIAVANSEEEVLAEKARLGLYIGVWKAITKLKMSPDTLDNPYHYQDALDDELEILLQCLPQTRAFKSKKHLLKSELIEKTMIFNERVANASEGSSYRQQLVDNVNNSLPKQRDINIAGKNANRLFEEWQKNILAELYILTNRFKIDDRVKALAYKKKLMQHIEKMIDNIKATTKQEIKELDHRTYEDEILAALDEVPIPSDETLNEEAAEILILLEVEQWFRDLPLLPSKRETANMEAKIFQDLLARKLYDIDAHCNPINRIDLMKQEIRRFLERLPLRQEEKPNMNFMIEELLNRLNNVNSDVVVVGGDKERKSVTFLEGYDYDAFIRNPPISSSFHGNPPPDPHDGSSYLITEGARVPDDQGWQMIRNPTGISEQYLTIEGLTGPRMSSHPTPAPQSGGVPPSNQSPNQGPFQTEQTKTDSSSNRPGSDNGKKNRRLSSRSFHNIMEDQVSDLRNQNQSGYGPPAGGYDPNRLQPPPGDINRTRIPCCGMPTPQDNGASAMPRPQQSGTNGMATLQDNEAYGISRPLGSSTPLERVSGTRPMLTPQQAGNSTPISQEHRPSFIPGQFAINSIPRQSETGAMLPEDFMASTMPRPQNRAYGMPIPQSGTWPMPRPQSSSTPQNLRTEQGTNPRPSTLDNGTAPEPTCYRSRSVRRSSAPPSYRPSRSQYNNSLPQTPDYCTPCFTPDIEDPQTPRKYRKERRDSARRKLSFDDSENDSDSDFSCRCMEKIWRCRRRKPVCEMRRFIPCEDMPYFMRMREPCYYRS